MIIEFLYLGTQISKDNRVQFVCLDTRLNNVNRVQFVYSALQSILIRVQIICLGKQSVMNIEYTFYSWARQSVTIIEYNLYKWACKSIMTIVYILQHFGTPISNDNRVEFV